MTDIGVPNITVDAWLGLDVSAAVPGLDKTDDDVTDDDDDDFWC